MNERFRRLLEKELLASPSTPESREALVNIFGRCNGLFRLAERVFPECALNARPYRGMDVDHLFFRFNFGYSDPRSIGIWGYRDKEYLEGNQDKAKIVDEYYKFCINFSLALEDETDLDSAQYKDKGLQFIVLKTPTGDVHSGFSWYFKDFAEQLRRRFEISRASEKDQHYKPPDGNETDVPFNPTQPFLDRMYRKINRPISGIGTSLFHQKSRFIPVDLYDEYTKDRVFLEKFKAEAEDLPPDELIYWETRPAPLAS